MTSFEGNIRRCLYTEIVRRLRKHHVGLSVIAGLRCWKYLCICVLIQLYLFQIASPSFVVRMRKWIENYRSQSPVTHIHGVHEKTITLDNVRQKCKIRTHPNQIVYTWLWIYLRQNAKFHKKILFTTRVINIQILTTKYFSFQYSVTYCSQALRRSGHTARETVHLLTDETPDFITSCGQPTVLALTQ